MAGSMGATTRAEDMSLDTQLEERVRIVILVRWMLIATAVVSAATGVPTHALMEPTAKLASPALPLTTLLTWIAFNAFFHLYYRRLFRLKSFLYGQILCDLLIPIPFLHFSAGIFSYGWMEYPLIVFESALILPHKRDTWLAAVLSCFLAAGFAIVEGAGWVKPVPSVISAAAATDVPSIVDRLPWTLGVILLAAFLGTYLMGKISERERQLRHLASRDGLTDLYNHSRFIRQLRSEVERAKRYGDTLSVLMMDLDGFKQLNDSLDHPEGDRALTAVAEILRSNTRRSDTEPFYEIDIPFRYGGDEFAVIAPGTPAASANEGGTDCATSVSGAVVLAERLRAATARAMEQEGLTVSIGVASYPPNGRNEDELVSAADAALYRAKRKGGQLRRRRPSSRRGAKREGDRVGLERALPASQM